MGSKAESRNSKRELWVLSNQGETSKRSTEELKRMFQKEKGWLREKLKEAEKNYENLIPEYNLLEQENETGLKNQS